MDNGRKDRQPEYSIKEVSEITGVPPHTLRFWEKRMGGLIAPRRTPGGQRRYDPQTVERIRLLKELVYAQGLTLSGARRELEQRQGVAEMLQQREMEIILSEITEMVRERLLSSTNEQ